MTGSIDEQTPNNSNVMISNGLGGKIATLGSQTLLIGPANLEIVEK